LASFCLLQTSTLASGTPPNQLGLTPRMSGEPMHTKSLQLWACSWVSQSCHCGKLAHCSPPYALKTTVSRLCRIVRWYPGTLLCVAWQHVMLWAALLMHGHLPFARGQQLPFTATNRCPERGTYALWKCCRSNACTSQTCND